MKITSFRIQNFKAFADTTLFLHPNVSILTGVNNCGKTTLIEAMALWVECFEKLLHESKSRVAGKYEAGDYVFGSAMRYFNYSDIYSVRLPNFEDIFHDRNIKNTVRLSAVLESKEGKRIEIPFLIASSSNPRYRIWLENENAFDYAAFKAIIKRFSSPVRSYFSAPLANIVAEESFVTDPVLQEGLRRRRSFELMRNRLYKLYPTEWFPQFQQDLSYVLFGVQSSLRMRLYSGSDKNYDIRVVFGFELNGNPVEKDVALLGSGSLQVMEVLLNLYNQVNGEHDLNLILLDEPDSHIHRDIQKRLLDVLARPDSSSQVVFTTHNESMIRAASPKQLFHVDSDCGELRCIYDRELEAINKPHFSGPYPTPAAPLIRCLGGNATGLDIVSAIEADLIVFVEGESDARLLDALLRCDMRNAEKKVLYWVLGSVSKVFQKIEGYSEVFGEIGNGMTLWEKSRLVFDRDELTDKHLQKLRQGLDKKYKIKSFTTTEAYTEESVLLSDPEKLASLLCMKYGLADENQKPLAEAIDEVCWQKLPAIRSQHFNPEEEKTHQYMGRYVSPLNTLFSAGIKDGDTLAFCGELKDYYSVQPICKVATKNDVEEIVNEAGERVGVQMGFDVGADFQDLVRLAADKKHLYFEAWTPLVDFLSQPL